MYDSLDVSRYIINHENEKSRPISNLRLQKLLYFVQAQFLVSNKESCFREDIEAWQYGPVVPRVYHRYKLYGSSSIPEQTVNQKNVIAESDAGLIDAILDKCAKYSTSALISLTHRDGPWKDSYEPGYDNVISVKSIRKYFGG